MPRKNCLRVRALTPPGVVFWQSRANVRHPRPALVSRTEPDVRCFISQDVRGGVEVGVAATAALGRVVDTLVNPDHCHTT
jgi:hypothetical protein